MKWDGGMNWIDLVQDFNIAATREESWRGL